MSQLIWDKDLLDVVVLNEDKGVPKQAHAWAWGCQIWYSVVGTQCTHVLSGLSLKGLDHRRQNIRPILVSVCEGQIMKNKTSGCSNVPLVPDYDN